MKFVGSITYHFVFNNYNYYLLKNIASLLYFFLFSHTLDVPYLVYGKHRIKRKVVGFEEASIAPVDEVQDLPVMASLQNLCVFDEPHALKVVCTSLQSQKELFKESLMYLFASKPYFLKVKKYCTEDDGACLTFTDEEGGALIRTLRC